MVHVSLQHSEPTATAPSALVVVGGLGRADRICKRSSDNASSRMITRSYFPDIDFRSSAHPRRRGTLGNPRHVISRSGA